METGVDWMRTQFSPQILITKFQVFPTFSSAVWETSGVARHIQCLRILESELTTDHCKDGTSPAWWVNAFTGAPYRSKDDSNADPNPSDDFPKLQTWNSLHSLEAAPQITENLLFADLLLVCVSSTNSCLLLLCPWRGAFLNPVSIPRHVRSHWPFSSLLQWVF